MRLPLIVLLVASVCLSLVPTGRAESGDPGETFLSAYMSAQQAEKLESQGSFKAALTKYRFAGSVLDQLQRRTPEWNPQVVEYRKKRVADAIQKLEEKIALEAPPVAVAPATATAGPALDMNSVPGVTNVPARAEGGGDAFDRAAGEMRAQMAAIKQQLEQSRQQLETVQQEKQRIATQLEAATNKLNQTATLSQAQAEQLRTAEAASKTNSAQQALQAQLDEAKAEADKAKAQLARAKASETDLQTQLEDARKQLQNKEKDQVTAVQAEALKKQMEKLRNALEDAKADREVAEEQGELLHQRAAKLAKERDVATSKNTQLAGSLADAEQKLVAMAKDREAAKGQLAEAKKTVQTVTTERDNALAQLSKVKDAKGQVEKLLAENSSLMKKLDEAQKTIATLNAASPDKDKEIASLKTQLTGVQDELAAAQREGTVNRTLIDALQKQLDDTNTASKGSGGPDQTKLTEENTLLRGIVLRELKEQARREQARKLVMSELDRMKVRSEALTQQISMLSQPVVKLTDAERALFRIPQMEIIDNTPGALSISIAAPASSPAAGPTPIDGDLPSKAASANNAAPSENPAPGPKVATESSPLVPPALQPLVKEAKDKFNRGDYLGAERVYEKVVSQDPTNVYALSNLGVSRFRAGHLKLAEETFKKVIALAPDDAFANATLGIVYFQQAKYDEATTALAKSISVNPKSATAHNFLGITAAKRGWPEAALKELETAVALEPNYAEAHFNLAAVLVDSQPADKEGARKHYKKAVELGLQPDAKFEESLK